jgi:hypothetical protein
MQDNEQVREGAPPLSTQGVEGITEGAWQRVLGAGCML